jgi:hypothetical protein
MRNWAEQRRQEMDRIGAPELARMFELVARLCEMEDQAARLKEEAILLPPMLFPAN